MVSMISRVMATTYLTFVPPRTLVLTYIVYALIQLLGYELIALGHYLPSISVGLFHSGMFIFGLGRGTVAFPYLILVRTFNRSSDAFAVVLWMTASLAGNNWGILLGTIMEDTLGLSWYASISAFSVLYLVTAILTYVLVPEEYLPEREYQGVWEYASSMAKIMKGYYGRKTSNWLNLLDFIFLDNQLYIVLFWAVFYFSKLGYGYTSSMIASVFPACMVLGTLVLQFVLGKHLAQKPFITVILVGLNFLTFMMLLVLGNDQSEVPIYMILLGCGAFVWVVPFIRSFTVDVSERAENPQEKYLVSNFMRTAREVFTGITMLLLGIFMEQSNFI